MTAVLLAAALVAAVAASPLGAVVTSRVVAAGSRAGTRNSRSAFPALVDALASALASGLALPMAFAEIAPTVPPPLASATRRVAASLTLGMRVADALVAYSSVLQDEDVAPLAMVLAAFTRTGWR